MATGRTATGALVLATLLVAAGCERVQVARLYALHLGESPGPEAWRAALPLPLKAGGGNLNGLNRRLADLAVDTDAVHLGSASCHHGPPITAPVLLKARAFYTDDAVHLEVRWDDSTADTLPRFWRRGPAGWELADTDEDGLAILWSRATGPFGCQEACHMRDVAIRQGEVIDLRSMFLAEPAAWEEAWVWKPSVGASALILGEQGFVTVAGETYRAVNSAVAGDPGLSPETRRAGTFGPEDRPARDADGRPLGALAARAPAYLFPRGDLRGGLSATAERTGEGWRVVLRRALQAGEKRQSFAPGGSYRFGVALFDATSTNHHIVRDAQTLELIAREPAVRAPAAGPVGGDPLREPAGMF